MPSFGQWRYTVDREATIAAYKRAEGGGADRCTCDNCHNFRLVRSRVYPDAFLALLDTLGIDPVKEAEAYHIARQAPGRHQYGGWFHFVGTLEETSKFPPIELGEGFEAWMCSTNAPRLSALREESVVELGFYSVAVPWLLDAPEPE